MKLRSYSQAILPLSFCLLAFIATARGQTDDDKWKNVQALSEKRSVVIETKAGKMVKAKFQSATSDVLRVLKGGRMMELNRNDVAAVYLGRRGSIIKWAFIGALAGAGAGVLAGAIYTASTKSAPLAGAAGFLYGIPAGAIIGAVSGGKTRKGELIYRY